jgi:uncharacterized membrane protein YccC
MFQLASILIEGVVGDMIRIVTTIVGITLFIGLLVATGSLKPKIFWFFIIIPCILVAVWILLTYL